MGQIASRCTISAPASDSERSRRVYWKRTRRTTDEGTPQGGPISPLLSNLVLDQLDRELERRGIDSLGTRTIATSMSAAGEQRQRLMGGLTRLLEVKLKLKVNREKSAVARPWERKFSVQLYKREVAKSADRAQSKGPVRSSHPNPYSSNSWYQHRDHGSRAGPLPSGLAKAISASAKPRQCWTVQQVDPASYTLCRL